MVGPIQQRKYTAQDNFNARNLILANAVDSTQSVASFTLAATNLAGQVVNVPLRNVGLNKRILLELAITASGVAANTMTLTPFGAANVLSQVVLTDLSNNQRINTMGWHLMAVSTAKQRRVWGAAATTDTPLGYGNNYGAKTFTAPTTITAAAGSNNVFLTYEIPISYSDTDLRGAIYANVVNATWQLQFTINPNFFVASTADNAFAVYQASAATLGTVASVTYTVYQNYLDQIPVGNGGPVLPLYDISTNYLLNNTSIAGLVANIDNGIAYANFRDFYSTTVVYDNTVLNAGTDINTFALQSANFTNIWKYDVAEACLFARNRIGDDFPKGMYYFDHRTRPISTVQYGNMQLNINPSSVAGAASAFAVGFEALALTAQVTNAGSLPST